MDHASTPTEEYGDNTDPMSIGTWMLHGVNAPHRVAMGWLGAADTALVAQSGVYDVAPLAADPSVATAPQTLMIWKADTLEYYYLSYRTPLGFDNYIDGSYYYRLSVHRYNSDGTLAKTYLLAGLADGESFVDSVNGITVTQISHDATHTTARIDLTPVCVASPPSLSISPQAQSAPAGSSLTYQVSITNRDASACPASAFSVSDAVPAGWTTAVSPATLMLGAGATGQANGDRNVPLCRADWHVHGDDQGERPGVHQLDVVSRGDLHGAAIAAGQRRPERAVQPGRSGESEEETDRAFVEGGN